ncbi:MAG TPA: (d)CMP kinase [Firmicutes bacterium]|nr:(d)CMP kinase [Bacillota bacterium]
MQIAIDGPAGAGKSSVAKEVARRLGLKYLDTGAMYRSITLKALREGICLHNGTLLAEIARKCNLEIGYDEILGNRIFLDGKDITPEIRSPEINKHVSIVSKSPELRHELVLLQKRVAKKSSGIVMEGRDIGTKVLENANIKFYIFASLEERSRRRWKEMKAAGVVLPFNDVMKEIAMRDSIDEKRDVSPLTIARDAVVIDTTHYSQEEVIEKILNFIKDKSSKFDTRCLKNRTTDGV